VSEIDRNAENMASGLAADGAERARAAGLQHVKPTHSCAAGPIAAEGVALAEAAGLMAEPAVVTTVGPLWGALVDAAETRGATAIAVGSRGLSGVKSVLLGSVSDSIVHHTVRPVLVVRHDEP
jgi:nucleotide-binding universal stress UspA family protein